jgi:hypothetical protein
MKREGKSYSASSEKCSSKESTMGPHRISTPDDSAIATRTPIGALSISDVEAEASNPKHLETQCKISQQQEDSMSLRSLARILSKEVEKADKKGLILSPDLGELRKHHQFMKLKCTKKVRSCSSGLAA